MNCSHKLARWLPVMLLLGSALAGCTDSASGGGGLSDDAAGGLNGGLPGRMLLGAEFVLDLGTGRSRPFVRSTSIAPDRLVRLTPNPDATRFHAVEEDCDRNDFYFLFTDCIVTFDAEGDEVIRLNIGKPVMSSVHESFDGKMLAFAVYDPEYEARSLTITDLDGNVLSEGFYEGGEFIRSDVTKVRWLPDGDLVYQDIGRNTIFRVVNPSVARPEDDQVVFSPATASMPGGEGANGLVGWFDVSPTNGDIAFVWNAGPNSVSRDDTLYLMGSDGSELRPFARASVITTLQAPQWSFDGEWIAVTAGGRAIAAQSREVVLAGLRSDATEVLLIDDGERIGTEDVVLISSDCRHQLGCGRETIQPTTSQAATGWFR